MSSETISNIISFLERKNRPAIASLIYLACGGIEILSLVSIITPFHISATFLDKIIWERVLDDNELIVNITLGIWILYGIAYAIRKWSVYFWQEKSNTEIRKIYIVADLLN